MADFSSRKTIKRTLKPHRCEQCGQTIEAGSKAEYLTGRYGGYFYSQHVHVECHEAAIALATLTGCWGEEFPWFQHNERHWEDEQWMRSKFPSVADRLGWALPDGAEKRADANTKGSRS